MHKILLTFKRIALLFIIVLYFHSSTSYVLGQGFPPDEPNYESTIPDINRTLDKNKPVVAIDGIADLRNGAATYTIPIVLPPGIQNMVPDLAIAYNSMGGNGVLGLGWGLEGLSVIKRGSESHIFNGRVLAPELNNDDNLFLDGQKLQLYEGGNLQVNSKYRTVSESFQQIEYMPGSTFWARQKDGVTRIYGASTDALLQFYTPDSILVPYAWLLDRVIDRNQNQIFYKYSTHHANNQALIKTIEYVSHGENSKAIVEFHYMSRSDVSEGYSVGNMVKSSVLLKEIIIKYDGQFHSAYEFAYAFDNTSKLARDFSRLVEVKYKNIDNEYVNSTVVEWGDLPQSEIDVEMNVLPTVWVPDPDRISEHYVADLNGDGVDDILRLVHTKFSAPNCTHGLTTYTRHEHRFRVIAYIRNKTTGNFQTKEILSTFYSTYRPGPCRRTPFCKIYLGDFDGDGYIDFGVLRTFTNSAEKNEFHYDIYQNDADGTGENFTLAYTEHINNQLPFGYDEDDDLAPNESPFHLIIGDFDGDGITDYSYQGFGSGNPSNNQWVVNYFDENFATDKHTFSLGSIGLLDSAHIGDFTGDGKAELLFNHYLNASIYQLTSRSTWRQITTGGFPNSYHYIKLGDFNGDGITDVLTLDNQNNWHITYFNGKVFAWPQIPITLPSLFTFPPDPIRLPKVIVSDVDNDGRDDLIVFLPSNQASNDLRIYYNKVTGWEITAMNNPTPVHSTERRLDYTFQIGDFTGSGVKQLFHPYYSNGSYFLSFLKDNESRKVKSILDGYNQLTTFSYTSMTDSDVYERGSNSSYPNSSFIAPIDFASSFSQYSMDAQLLSHVSVKYKEGVVNKRGLGNLGYETIEVSDHLNETITVNFFASPLSTINAASKPFLPIRSETRLLDGSMLISTKEIEYEAEWVKEYTHNGNTYKYFLPQIIEKHSKDHTKSISSIHEFQYDLHGNITTEDITLFSEALGETVFHENIARMSFISGGNWIPWLPEEIQIHKDRIGPDLAIEEYYYEYDQNGNLIKEIVNPNTIAELIKEYQYDSFGNVIEEKHKPNSMADRIYTTLWSSCKRFPVSKTNPLNWTEFFEYDEVLGVLTKQIDVNGLETEYEYDGFGRETKTTFPDGNYVEKSYEWVDGYNPFTNVLFYIHTSGSAMPDMEEWYDPAGRLVHKRAMNQVDQWVTEDKEYTAKGQLAKKSLPYAYMPQASEWVEYEYDAFGRVIEINTPTSQINKSYTADNIVTIHNLSSGKMETRHYDATGLLIKTQDNIAEVVYEYDSWGNVETTHTPGGSIIFSVYDDFGRQTELHDPAAGIVSYSYDALGQIIQQTDAKGQITTYTYDLLGRLIERETPNGVDEFHYDSQLLGLLSVMSNDDVRKEYVYDIYGRIEYTVDAYDDAPSFEFTMVYEYDTYGNLEYVTYPDECDNFKVRYEYNHNSFLERIVRDDTDELIWEWVQDNDFGQITAYNLGKNYVVWERLYNPVTGFPEAIYDSDGLISYGYEFEDHTANLLEKQDNIYGMSDVYTFDVLDRLTSIQTIDQSSSSVGGNYTYSDDGSILTKPRIGTYNNDLLSGRTLSVTNPANDIPADDQTILYNAFNKVSYIEEGAYEAYFVYGPDQHRFRMTIEEGGNPYIDRFYVNDRFEVDFYEGGYRYMAYIPLPSGDDAIYVHSEALAVFEMYYAVKDYQGTVMMLYDEENAFPEEEYSYDPWGKRRSVYDWDPSILEPDPRGQFHNFYYRGYTGHEHLDCFNLINMNGRLYDPHLGRMLSPDNYVQDPENTQNFNRYSYCWNNPLKYTDPSGDFIHIVLGAAIGGAVNLGIKLAQGKISSFGDGLAAFGIGAAAGAIGAATGGAAFAALGGAGGGAGGFFAGAAGGAIGTAFASPVQSYGNSMYFGDPVMTGRQFLMGVGIGALTGGVINGGIAAYNGRGFWNGSFSQQQVMPVQPLSTKPIPTKNHLDVVKPEVKPSFSEFTIDTYPQPIRPLDAAKGGSQLSTRFVSTSKGLTDVQPTLNRIASGGKFPHRNDGSIFKNFEGLLPKQNTGFYREFVHPTPGVTGPGPMRIVTGQNGGMWFTPDHYKTFIPIR